MRDCILVTGGAGFIGSNFVLRTANLSSAAIVNLDKLTYAGSRENLKDLSSCERHTFIHGDVCDRELIRATLIQYSPRAIVHFAAETHVDRSIEQPGAFIETNVNGTFTLLEQALLYWRSLSTAEQESFRFLNISTDEVYGSLAPDEPAFTEESCCAPNNPYAASKAAADHMVRAYRNTYGLPTFTTRSSNNYGPHQYPEKLIPLVIRNALRGRSIPIYGDGQNVRDWIFVEDHCAAIELILERGWFGETYNVGSSNEKTNLEIVETICSLLDGLVPDSAHRPHSSLIKFVEDRPGHDRRYSMSSGKLRQQLGWFPKKEFRDGLLQTISWYLKHRHWLD